jgi:hypothetical protein
MPANSGRVSSSAWSRAQRLCHLGLGASLKELGASGGGVLLGGALKDNLGDGGGELLDLVDGNAGDVAHHLVDADLRGEAFRQVVRIVSAWLQSA